MSHLPLREKSAPTWSPRRVAEWDIGHKESDVLSREVGHAPGLVH